MSLTSKTRNKYIGNRRLMAIAIATLATDQALLLFGVPGTAKSWVNELSSALKRHFLLIISHF